MKLKDSGDRRDFGTGAVRDMSSGKGMYHLLSPIFKRRLARWLELGANKYSARNWENGIPLSSFVDSLMRHIDKHLEGWRDEDHLAAAAFNLQGLIHTEEMIKRGLLPESLNDLPNYLPENWDYDGEMVQPRHDAMGGWSSPKEGNQENKKDWSHDPECGCDACQEV